MIVKKKIYFDPHKFFAICSNGAACKAVFPNCVVALPFNNIGVEHSLRRRIFLENLTY